MVAGGRLGAGLPRVERSCMAWSPAPWRTSVLRKQWGGWGQQARHGRNCSSDLSGIQDGSQN